MSEHTLAAELAELLSYPNDQLAGELRLGTGSKATKLTQVARAILERLHALPHGSRWSISAEMTANEREALDAVLKRSPRAIELVLDYLPSAKAIMRLVEHKLGSPISSGTLDAANKICAAIVDNITNPRLKNFLVKTLAVDSKGVISITVDELAEFLSDPYRKFSRAQANGMTSRVGGYNEELIWRAFENSGVSEHCDQTGKKGLGDIQVRTNSQNEILAIEVKSYAARERLLRGLADCRPPKVGVGFFISGKEFNASRTGQLVATGASAIYMPTATLDTLSSTVRAWTNHLNGRFYRPLDQLVGDMKKFIANGANAFG